MADHDRLSDVWLAGVDGCKKGWLAVLTRPDGAEVRVREVVPLFTDLFMGPKIPATIAVDIPIGLLEHSFGGRIADNEVRQLLGRRGSSVFPVPSRRAVFAEPGPFKDPVARRRAHQRACAIAEATSTPPRRINIFSFGILPKIREVDVALRNNAPLIHRVFETHPELAFQQLNIKREVIESKKSNEGLQQRRELLVGAGLPPAIVNGPVPKGAKQDDLLDALACAAIARRIHAGVAQPYPNPPPRDAFGLPMAIWA